MASPVIVQHGDTGATAFAFGATARQVLPGNCTPGNAIALYVVDGSGARGSTVITSAMGTFYPVSSYFNSDVNAPGSWYLCPYATSAADTVVANNVNGTNWGAYAFELSGAYAPGGVDGGVFNTGQPVAAGVNQSLTVSCAVGDVILIGNVLYTGSANPFTTNPGSPWVLGNFYTWVGVTPQISNTVAAIVATSTSETATWNNSVATYPAISALRLVPITGTPVGSPVTGSIGGGITLDPTEVGDGMVLYAGIGSGNASQAISSITGGNCSGWVRVAGGYDATQTQLCEVWVANTSAVGSSALTINYAGTGSCFIAVQQFTVGAPATWTTTSGSQFSHSTTHSPWPTFTTTASGLWVGTQVTLGNTISLTGFSTIAGTGGWNEVAYLGTEIFSCWGPGGSAQLPNNNPAQISGTPSASFDYASAVIVPTLIPAYAPLGSRQPYTQAVRRAALYMRRAGGLLVPEHAGERLVVPRLALGG